MNFYIKKKNVKFNIMNFFKKKLSKKSKIFTLYLYAKKYLNISINI